VLCRSVFIPLTSHLASANNHLRSYWMYGLIDPLAHQVDHDSTGWTNTVSWSEQVLKKAALPHLRESTSFSQTLMQSLFSLQHIEEVGALAYALDAQSSLLFRGFHYQYFSLREGKCQRSVLGEQV